MWNGKEFLNTTDHGREMQFSFQLNNQLECDNPTEAGSDRDGKKTTSSSRLLSSAFLTNNTVFQTVSRPAYWIERGHDAHGYSCGGGVGTGASGHTVTKTVSLGIFPDLPNVMVYDITWHTPTAESIATMSAPGVFLAPEFSSFLSFDPITGAALPINAGTSYSGLPIILSTPDGQYALGLYAATPGRAGRAFFYGAVRVPGATGTNAVTVNFTDNNLVPGDYTYRSFVIVGKVSDVTGQMKRLAARLR